MGELQVHLPLFSEGEWKTLLSGLSLAEVQGRADLQYRRLASAFLLADSKGDEQLGAALNYVPTQDQIKEENNLGKYYNDLKDKLFKLRDGLTKLEQENVKHSIDQQIDEMLGGASEAQ